MAWSFVTTTLILIGSAVGVGLVICGLVYAGGSRGSKRYRPGRPFVFTPVWFLSAPQRQARAGLSTSRELVQAPPAAVARPARPRATGGASDRW
jgi:hypothetical protein